MSAALTCERAGAQSPDAPTLDAALARALTADGPAAGIGLEPADSRQRPVAGISCRWRSGHWRYGPRGRQRSSVVNAPGDRRRASAGSEDIRFAGRRMTPGGRLARAAGGLGALGQYLFRHPGGRGDAAAPLMAGIRYVVAGLLMFPFALRSGGPALRAADRPRASGWWSAVLVGTLLLAGRERRGLGRRAQRPVRAGRPARGHGSAVADPHRPDPQRNQDRRARPGWLARGRDRGGVPGRAVRRRHGTHAGAGHGGAGGSPGTGIVIILLASVSWASGTIASRRVPLPSRPLLATAMQMLAGGVVLLAAAAVTGEFSRFHPSQVSAASWLALAYLIGPGSIIAFSAYMVAVRRLPTATVATYAYVNPIIAVFLGATFLGEALTASMLVGGALIVVAVALVVRSQAAATR